MPKKKLTRDEFRRTPAEERTRMMIEAAFNTDVFNEIAYEYYQDNEAALTVNPQQIVHLQLNVTNNVPQGQVFLSGTGALTGIQSQPSSLDRALSAARKNTNGGRSDPRNHRDEDEDGEVRHEAFEEAVRTPYRIPLLPTKMELKISPLASPRVAMERLSRTGLPDVMIACEGSNHLDEVLKRAFPCCREYLLGKKVNELKEKELLPLSVSADMAWIEQVRDMFIHLKRLPQLGDQPQRWIEELLTYKTFQEVKVSRDGFLEVLERVLVFLDLYLQKQDCAASLESEIQRNADLRNENERLQAALASRDDPPRRDYQRRGDPPRRDSHRNSTGSIRGQNSTRRGHFNVGRRASAGGVRQGSSSNNVHGTPPSLADRFEPPQRHGTPPAGVARRDQPPPVERRRRPREDHRDDDDGDYESRNTRQRRDTDRRR